jgi:hypothetical protein
MLWDYSLFGLNWQYITWNICPESGASAGHLYSFTRMTKRYQWALATSNTVSALVNCLRTDGDFCHNVLDTEIAKNM